MSLTLKIIGGFTAVLMVILLTEKPETADEANQRHTAETMAHYKQQAAQRFRDPSSVTFGPLYLHTNARGAVHLCGLVNARNGFGGMTGWETFYVLVGPNGYVGDTVLENSFAFETECTKA